MLVQTIQLYITLGPSPASSNFEQEIFDGVPLFCHPEYISMTSITSIQSLTLDIPPSCIEFCSAAPQYFVVGTYFLEKKEQDASQLEAEEEDLPKEGQKRTGSLIVFRLDGDKM